jgi:hypothetical protein
MHVKLFQVVSFKIENRGPICIKDMKPRTTKLVWYDRVDKFVTSVDTTMAFDIAITEVMLGGSFVNKNSRTKRTLVGNHNPVHMISKIMSRQFGLDFVVGKLTQTVILVATFRSRGHKDITFNNMRRLVLLSSLLTVNILKVMHMPSPKLIEIDRTKPFGSLYAGRDNHGVIDYPSEHVLINILDDTQVPNILTKLHNIWVCFWVCCIPFKDSKPSSKHTARGVRIPGQTLGPFESTNSKFNMCWQYLDFFENLTVGHSVNIPISMHFVCFATQKGSGSFSNKTNNPIISAPENTKASRAEMAVLYTRDVNKSF